VPTAERAGVILGFENLLPAGENIRAVEKIGSPVFQVYYDIGNATNVIDVDPAEEIRRYGRGMLCQVHLKDRGYLGEGKVNVPKALAALEEIGYDGHLILETGAPSKNIDADLKRNVEYLRGLRRA
jgi:sugar phosphate isomerase/epimerase